MAKREKIILVIMALVVAFGVYDFLFSSGAKKKPVAPTTGVDETNRFIADVADSLKDDFTETNMYIISRSGSEWEKDPFIKIAKKSELPVEDRVKIVAKQESVLMERSFNYTGFLKVGERTLAIINGLEYEQGEEIERGGHVVKQVEPNRVVLGIPGQEDITVFLKEMN